MRKISASTRTMQRSIAHGYGQDGNLRKVMLQNSQLGIIWPEVCEIYDNKVRAIE